MEEKKITITGNDFAGTITDVMRKEPFSELGITTQMMFMFFGAELMRKLFDDNNEDENADKESTFEEMLEKEKR